MVVKDNELAKGELLAFGDGLVAVGHRYRELGRLGPKARTAKAD
jgi:hypothetical protein